MKDSGTEIKARRSSLPIIPNHPDTLILCVGNSGRADDGLGWAFLDQIERDGIFRGTSEYRYQLGVEDAELISHHASVLIVDAHTGNLQEEAALQRCAPECHFSFTTHEVPPGVILHLCRDLYGKDPEVYCLMIRGEKWDLEIGLSQAGKKNLKTALRRFYAALS